MKKFILTAFLLALPSCGSAGDFTVTEEETTSVDAMPGETSETDTLLAATKDAGPEVDGSDTKPSCVTDLSYLGPSDDFTIAFMLTTTASKPSPLLNQRPTCSALQPFWDLQMLASGALDLQIGGSGDNVEAKSTPTITVNDGIAHKIVIRRSGTMLSFTVDGKDAGKSSFSAATGKLPSLKTGETDKDACPMEPLAGKITETCLSR